MLVRWQLLVWIIQALRRFWIPITLFLLTTLIVISTQLAAQADGPRSRCNEEHPDFPNILQIVQARRVQEAVNLDWQDGLRDPEARERGRWILWDQRTGTYQVSPVIVGDNVTGDREIAMGAPPADIGSIYLVGMYHTHPPNSKYPVVGPSAPDIDIPNRMRISGLVIDSNPDTADPNDYQPYVVGPSQSCAPEDLETDGRPDRKLPPELLNPSSTSGNGTDENSSDSNPNEDNNSGAGDADASDGPTDKGTGTSFGDPHIITLDGLSYSFQTVGEFLLEQSADGQFMVQTRQSAVPDRDLSLNTAVAVKVGGDRISYYAPTSDKEAVLKVNGTVQTLADETVRLPGGGLLQEQVSLRPIQIANLEFVNVTVSIPKDQQGKTIGLLGDFDGDRDNDLRTRSGELVPSQSSYGSVENALANLLPVPVPISAVENAFFEQLNRNFANSWRIRSEESLFDYDSGQSTDTFTDRGFPRSYHSIASLLPAQIRQAETVCQAAGMTAEMLQGCIMDVGLTGESGFAESMVNALTRTVVDQATSRVLDEIRSQVDIPIPIPFRIPGF
jgi:hypothetical protein